MRRVRHSPVAGVSLLEVLITLAIFASLSGAVFTVAMSTKKAQGTAMTASDLGTRASRALSRIAWALTPSTQGSLDPSPVAPAWTSSLAFQRPLDYAAGAVVWDEAERIEFRLDAGELDDGVDNDGDELVDEGTVVWVLNDGLADERELVVCSDVRRLLEGELDNGLDDNGNGLVDEAGLSFDVDGSTVTVRLSLEDFDPTGFRLTRTCETSVRLRNPAP